MPGKGPENPQRVKQKGPGPLQKIGGKYVVPYGTQVKNNPCPMW